jgi:dihydroorotate dehydrogenase
MDPEKAHSLALAFLRWGLIPPVSLPRLNQSFSFLGKTLPHPLGLAAGMDKDGVALRAWEKMGFAFVEVGTVTPQPQKGNPKPRLFRLTEDRAIINRLGFNNSGVYALAKRLERASPRIPVGINIGKNAQTPNDLAWKDYAECARVLQGMGDYLVLNVSSPNTPDLRELQSETALAQILDAVKKANPSAPLFLKISPDETEERLKAILRVSEEYNLSGIVATNTTLNRPPLSSRFREEAGGLSGAPLRDRAQEVCARLREWARSPLSIIGVGGILTGKDLRNRLRAGATVCQIYTALIYRGPYAVKKILQEYLQENASAPLKRE